MAMENFDSKSPQKRSWEESEECPTTKTVSSSSLDGVDQSKISKKARLSTETESDPAEVDSASFKKLPEDRQGARTSSTEGYDSGINGLEADDGRDTDEVELLRDAADSATVSDTAVGNTDQSENQEAGGDNGDDDVDDSCSEISDLSGMSSEGWRPVSGAMTWVHRQMEAGVNPRDILNRILPRRTVIPDDIDDVMLWRAVIEIVTEPPRRKKLDDVNTIDDVIRLLRTSEKIMVLTGAGVSVSCGIPDFRSKDGIYARLAVEYPDLPDPQAMFDICYFKRNQGPFFKFAKEIYPGQFEPSVAHKFVRLIETHGKLLRNYTQNIDTLEQVAHIERVIQCHGSFATATCMVCKYKTDADGVKEDIMNQIVPRCPRCPPEEELAIMKPDIVFFGESLPEEFHRQMELDKDECDLLIVMGSSLKVRPVALIPNSLPSHIPQILINRESLKHMTFDVELLGNCDVIVNELCRRLGDEWDAACTDDIKETSREITRDEMVTPTLPQTPSGGESVVAQSSSSSTDHPSSVVSPSAVPETQAANSETQHENVTSTVTSSSSTSTHDADSSSTSDLQSTESCATHKDDTVSRDASSSDSSEKPKVIGSSESSSNNSGKLEQGQYNDSETTGAKQSDSESKGSDVKTAKDQNVQDTQSSEVEGHEHSNTGSHGNEEEVRDAHERDEPELAMLRASWQPKLINLASRLPAGSHLFLPPNRYVFQGAEVYDDIDDSESDSDDSEGQHSDSDPSPDDETSLSSLADMPTPQDSPDETSTSAPNVAEEETSVPNGVQQMEEPTSTSNKTCAPNTELETTAAEQHSSADIVGGQHTCAPNETSAHVALDQHPSGGKSEHSVDITPPAPSGGKDTSSEVSLGQSAQDGNTTSTLS